MTTTAEGAELGFSRAAAHVREAERLRDQAEARQRGREGEEQVRGVLDGLAGEGWVALHGRHWPGTTSADIDHLLVGPGGVVVLDSKNLRGRIRLTQGVLLQGQADISEEIDGIAAQLRAVEEVVASLRLAPLLVTAGLVLAGRDFDLTAVGRVHIVGEYQLARWLRALGRQLSAADVVAIAAAVESAIPPFAPPAAVVPAVVPAPQRRVPDYSPTLFDATQVDLAGLEAASRLPMDRWMVWLHPSQLEVVRRRYTGPSRVRGEAGCGKSVVALHRAAYLAAHEPGDLLFTTFVRTLPRNLETMYRRLSPHTVERVSFEPVHALSLRILGEAGVRHGLDATKAQTAFSRAWSAARRTSLGDIDVPPAYWQEEVASVIKGRGLVSWEEYADLPRRGRRIRLTGEQRAQVWDLYVRYQELLEDKGTRDFADVVTLAREVAERGAARTFRFVFVDEVQDLSLQALRLLAALPSDPRDGLTVVGDGRQAVYPGGFTLKEAGIAVSGRSTVLTVNYRNTRQIAEVARAALAPDDVDDIEVDGEDRPSQVLRDGLPVRHVTAGDAASADMALLAALRDDADGGVGFTDAAVLCRKLAEAKRYRDLLRASGVPVLDLYDHDGTAVDAVKVGTVKRAKGLEFDRVYVPRIDSYSGSETTADPESAQLAHRELHVALSRARSLLWVSTVEQA